MPKYFLGKNIVKKDKFIVGGLKARDKFIIPNITLELLEI
jgi:hypothetical protein